MNIGLGHEGRGSDGSIVARRGFIRWRVLIPSITINVRMRLAIVCDGLIIIRSPWREATCGLDYGTIRTGIYARGKFRRRLLQRSNIPQIFSCHNFVGFLAVARTFAGHDDNSMRGICRRAFTIVRALRHPAHLIAGVDPVDARWFPLL